MKCICEIQLIYSNIRGIIIPINKSMMYWKIKHKYIKIAYIYIHTHTWIGEGNEEMQPTSLFLPGKSHGQRNLVSYNP